MPVPNPSCGNIDGLFPVSSGEFPSYPVAYSAVRWVLRPAFFQRQRLLLLECVLLRGVCGFPKVLHRHLGCCVLFFRLTRRNLRSV